MNMTRLFEKALEAVLRLPPFFRQKSENRAREIAGEGANHEILKHAHRLAEGFFSAEIFQLWLRVGKRKCYGNESLSLTKAHSFSVAPR
jgi:hypothetical protein